MKNQIKIKNSILRAASKHWFSRPESVRPRNSTINEIMTWGVCPVCRRGPGRLCKFKSEESGIFYSVTTRIAAHVKRMDRAPRRVRLVAA